MNEKCAYCGETDETVATHSGTLECSRCWTYRKLDRPAALHWAKASKEFLSNVDMYDWMTYLTKRAGNTQQEVSTMLKAATKVELESRYLVEHGPEHRWSDEVQAHFENEQRAKDLLDRE